LIDVWHTEELEKEEENEDSAEAEPNHHKITRAELIS